MNNPLFLEVQCLHNNISSENMDQEKVTDEAIKELQDYCDRTKALAEKILKHNAFIKKSRTVADKRKKNLQQERSHLKDVSIESKFETLCAYLKKESIAAQNQALQRLGISITICDQNFDGTLTETYKDSIFDGKKTLKDAFLEANNTKFPIRTIKDVAADLRGE